MKFCSVEGCNKPHKAKGYCMKHYRRFLRSGATDKSEFVNKGKNCSVDWCNKESFAKGLCKYHYNKSLKYDDSTINVRASEKGEICIMKNCNNEVIARGICKNHYASFLRRYKK